MATIFNLRLRPTRSCLVCVLAFAIPLLLTLFAWRTAVDNIYRQNLSDFEKQAVESEKSLHHLIESYNSALMAGVGLFTSQRDVTAAEWQKFVEALKISETLPGINGIGYIARVGKNDLDQHISAMRHEGNPYFAMHPQGNTPPFYIISYIEPIESNRPAAGLNIAFEPHRREAAERAMETGAPAITRKITLVQDARQSPGFLLLHPMYRKGAPTGTAEERRATLHGWIYAPFIADNFFREITLNQGKTINIRIYDGETDNSDLLIYSSAPASHKKPAFTIRKNIEVMQKTWLIVWESAPAFEKTLYRYGPLIILASGIACSFLFGMLIITLIARQEKNYDLLTSTEPSLFLPSIIFMAMTACAFLVHNSLANRESFFLHMALQQETENIKNIIQVESREKMLALRRMAERWNDSSGSPETLWRHDAANYLEDIPGLSALEWVDKTYRIRWVEPVEGNQSVIGMDILFDDARKKALQGAAEKRGFTITPPLDLIQGYRGLIAYTPLEKNGRFDGFLAAVFNTDNFMNTIISPAISDNFSIDIRHGDKPLYAHIPTGTMPKDSASWSVRQNIMIEDVTWDMTITPTQAYINQSLTILPRAVLILGIFISALLAITVRAILISRAQTIKLRRSEETLRTAIDSAAIGMALVGLDGKWLRVNRALCDIIGYTEDELLLTNFQQITHPDDLESDLANVRSLMSGEIISYTIDKRYYHKRGHIVWARLSVSLARHTNGQPRHFISQIMDITEQREIETLKNDFISIISHELRTPVTSIRGALGLIQGTMVADIPARAMNLVNIAFNNCERLIRLINDLLDLDKLIAGQMEFIMRPEPVDALLAEGIMANTPYAAGFNVTLSAETVPPGLFIHTDASRWQQVFANLLSNAIKFSPEGETITISATTSGNHVQFSVTDRGPGIPVEFQKRIFSKFAQASTTGSRRTGGTGLGLNISREIVMRMGGDIGFETETGQGTTFWFTIPLCGAPAP